MAAQAHTYNPAWDWTLDTLDDAAKERVFVEMRKARDEVDRLEKKHRELSPRFGEIAAGGAHMDPFIKAEGINGLLRALNKGQTLAEAVKAGSADADYAAEKWNKSRKDYQVHRSTRGVESSNLMDLARRLDRAAGGGAANPGYGRHLDENYEDRPVYKFFDSEKAARTYLRLVEGEGRSAEVAKALDQQTGTKRWGVRLVRAGNPIERYVVRFIKESDAPELVNLYHLARVPLSGTGKDTKYERMLWASKEFHKAHTDISETAAYKDLDGLLSNWFGQDTSPRKGRGRRNPDSESAAMYESFHGEPSQGIVEFTETEHYHGNLAELGVMVGLKVRTVGGEDVTLGFAAAGEDSEENPKSKDWIPFNSYEDVVFSAGLVNVLRAHGIASTLRAGKGRRAGKSAVYIHRRDEDKANKISSIVLREAARRRQNPFWPFDGSFDRHTVYHVPTGDKYTIAATHAGHKIYKTPGGEYVIPALDRETRLESLREAKKFAGAWKGRNPKAKKGPFGSAAALVSETTGYLDGQLGKMLNPGNLPEWPGAENVYRKIYKFLDWYGSQQSYGKRSRPTEDHREIIDELSRGDENKLKSRLHWIRTFYPKFPLDQQRSNPSDDSYSGSAVLLTGNESGTQVYFVGGDQSLDVAALSIPSPDRDSVVVGEAWGICYSTCKSFDKFKLLDYVHGFGEEDAHPRLKKNADLWEDAKPPEKLFGTGQLPTLRYDTLNSKLYLDGGIYTIKPEGITE